MACVVGRRGEIDVSVGLASIGVGGVQKFSSVLNAILDIDKLVDAKMKLEALPFDLHAALCHVADMCMVKRPDRDFQLVVDMDATLPRVIVGDRKRVMQVFTNLLPNALKFMPFGYVAIRGRVVEDLSPPPFPALSPHAAEDSSAGHCVVDMTGQTGPLVVTQQHHRGGGRVVTCTFEVEDLGCGIPQDMWEAVFDNHIQADASIARTHGGSGLGLGIVRSLVQLMGGTVQITQKKPLAPPGNSGTLFLITLPFITHEPNPTQPYHHHHQHHHHQQQIPG